MSDITEFACRKLAERWKAEFGGGLSPKKVGGAWARRLRNLFDTFEDVTRYYNWFVEGWTNSYAPSFQQFYQYCRANTEQHRPERPQIAVDCGFCGGCGSITVPAPLDEKGKVEWDTPGFNYEELWPHSRVYGFALPCRCEAGSAASNGILQNTPRDAYKLRSLWVDYLRANDVDSPGYAEQLSRQYQRESWQAYTGESPQERADEPEDTWQEELQKKRRQIAEMQESETPDLAEAMDVPEDQIPF